MRISLVKGYVTNRGEKMYKLVKFIFEGAVALCGCKAISESGDIIGLINQLKVTGREKLDGYDSLTLVYIRLGTR